MRRALARIAAATLVVLVALAGVAAGARPARAESADRLAVTAYESVVAERFHSIAADTLGLSYGRAYSGGMGVDFRVIDLPMGKSARPSLHVSGGASTDERILGPAIPGQLVGSFKVIDLSGGVAFELPLEAFLKGNAGVAMRLGWDGDYLLTRTGGDNFLARSKARLAFVRTSGGLMGSSIGIGMGRDETFGWDASAGRWDVRISIQGRLATVPVPAPAPRPGVKPAPAAARPAGDRLLWLFADAAVDTDGGPRADGLRARVGVALDLSAFFTSAFTAAR